MNCCDTTQGKAGEFIKLLAMTLLFLVGCAGLEPQPNGIPSALPPAVEFVLPDGFTVEVAATGLSRPTQMIWGPDGRLWVAQLFGGERDAAGQIVALNLATSAQEVLLEGLNKPTGLAVLDGALWIATENELLRAALDNEFQPQGVEVILTNLPNNGRSNGTLTVTPDGYLLYETSGRRSGNLAVAESGTLWRLNPAEPDHPTAVATGLKNAYAHVFDNNNRLWITEIGDGSVTGANFEGQPPEELNLVVPGGSYGWPQCFADREPALNRNGTAEICRQSEAPVALFPPQSTPTSIAVAPWDDSVLLVALWVAGDVIAVQIEAEANGRLTAVNSQFISGMTNPQHLLPTPDGALLISDYGNGTLYRITKG